MPSSPYTAATIKTAFVSPLVPRAPGAVTAVAAPGGDTASPVKAHDPRGQYLNPVNGTLSGVVAVDGVPIFRAVVRCYYRSTGALVASALTAADGSFSIKNVDPTDLKAYFVIAFDPDGGVQYNAIIFDRVTPV